MKLIRLILISACLTACFTLAAQEATSKEACYTYELWETGKVTKDADTIYQVVILMDTCDLNRYDKLIMETSKQKKELDISKEKRKEESRIKIKTRNYHLDMEEWESGEEFRVYAKKADGSVVELAHHPRASEFYHEVQSTGPSVSDLKIYEEPEDAQEEDQQ